MELKELLANPGTAAFSRIKYLHRFGDDDQIKEFCNGLFLAAVEGKYQGNWDLLNDFLERWEDTAIGLQFRTLKLPDTGDIPWATLEKPLGEPGNADQQRVIVEDALRLLMSATVPGTVEALPYRWRREDYASIREERGSILAPTEVSAPGDG